MVEELVVARFLLLQGPFETPACEDRLSNAGAHRVEGAGGIEEGMEHRALETTFRGERDAREEGGSCRLHIRVRRDELRLRLLHVRPPYEQLRRQPGCH